MSNHLPRIVAEEDDDDEDDPLAIRPGQRVPDPTPRPPVKERVVEPPDAPPSSSSSSGSESDRMAIVPTSDDEEAMMGHVNEGDQWARGFLSRIERSRREMVLEVEVESTGDGLRPVPSTDPDSHTRHDATSSENAGSIHRDPIGEGDADEPARSGPTFELGTSVGDEAIEVIRTGALAGSSPSAGDRARDLQEHEHDDDFERQGGMEVDDAPRSGRGASGTVSSNAIGLAGGSTYRAEHGDGERVASSGPLIANSDSQPGVVARASLEGNQGEVLEDQEVALRSASGDPPPNLKVQLDHPVLAKTSPPFTQAIGPSSPPPGASSSQKSNPPIIPVPIPTSARARTRSLATASPSGGRGLGGLAPRREVSPTQGGMRVDMDSEVGMSHTRSPSLSLSPPPLLPPQVTNQVPPAQSPSDPLLQAFRSTRTFRTRTAIQLEPYTRERKRYTEFVKTGGRRLIEELMGGETGSRVGTQVAEDDGEDEELPFGVYRDGLESDVEDEETLGSVAAKRSEPIAPIALVDVEDEDYDAYFARYGTVAEAPSDSRLQAIARKRIRVYESEVRKHAREARAARRAETEAEKRLQRERLELRRAEKERENSIKEKRAREREALKRARVDAMHVPTARVALRSDSDGEVLVRANSEVENLSRPALIHARSPLRQPASKKRKKSHRSTHLDPDDEPEQTTARSYRGNGSSRRMSPTPDLVRSRGIDDVSSPFSLGGDVGMDIDIWSDDDDVQVVSRGSTAREPHRRRLHSSTSMSAESDASESMAVPKKKVKVLKRVLPAFMIKRLADDQAKKDRARDRALADAPVRTPRPGKRTRPTTAAAEMADWFDNDSIAAEPLAGVDPIDGPEDVPVLAIFSSDSEMSLLSLSDEDPHDDDAAESVRMLNRGDFDSLLYGGPRTKALRRNGGLTRNKPTKRSTTDLPRQRPRRLGRLRQTGLNLPSERRRANAARPPSKRRIFMDDETIFSRGSAPRSALRPMLAAPQAPTRHVNTPGSGGRAPPRLARNKGSSTGPAIGSSPTPTPVVTVPPPAIIANVLANWEEIREFQVDFEVKPLASGVTFDSDSLTGRGRLHFLMTLLRGGAPSINIRSLEAYSLVLPPTPSTEDLVRSLPILRDGMEKDLGRMADGSLPPENTAAVDTLEYISGISTIVEVMSSTIMTVVDTLALVSSCFQTMSKSRAPTSTSRSLLTFGWTLVASLWHLHAAVDPVMSHITIIPLLVSASENLMLALLQHGFNRTMKPLKEVMSFLAESPVIRDISAECWVMLLHTLRFAELKIPTGGSKSQLTFQSTLETTLTAFMPDHDRSGPRASEKMWYLAFGLAGLSQFDESGVTREGLESAPLWFLVRRALDAIALPQMTEEEELRKRHHLKTRDRYVKIMVVRCLRLNSIWQWQCDKESFHIATRDLGTVFKDRHHRNFPTESSADFPAFISEYDLDKTEEIDMDDSAYNLYLRLVAVTASDLIVSASTVVEAESMVKEVQRLMLSIFPFSAISLRPGEMPSSRQTAALVNRYSTAVVAGLFVPSLLPWLLNNSAKWVDFGTAHVETRRIVIRGLMYLAVASRHHRVTLEPVVDKLAKAFDLIRMDSDKLKEGEPERGTLGRLLILIIGSFRHIIRTSSFRKDPGASPVYPDPILLHPCWTSRLKSTELVTDRRAGNEVVDCIQAFLDARHAAMPDSVKRNRAAKLEDESQSSGFDDFAIEFTDEDILALGGGMGSISPEFLLDQEVAKRLAADISPGLYDLLSNTFSSSETSGPQNEIEQGDRQIYISKLTRCWADCASVLVVDHKEREWSTYLGPGKESWERFGDELGKRQIALSFMLNVARLDPNVFSSHSEEFVRLLLQALVANLITVEPQYIAAVMAMPGASEHPVFESLDLEHDGICDRTTFMARRTRWLRVIFANFARILSAPDTQSSMKVFLYRCANLLVSAMLLNYQLISLSKLAQRVFYSSLCDEVVEYMRKEAGSFLNEAIVPKLKAFPLYRPIDNSKMSLSRAASSRESSAHNSPRPSNAVAGPSGMNGANPPPVPLDPYKVLPTALRRPVQVFTAENALAGVPPGGLDTAAPSLPTLLSLTPIAYSSRLSARQILLTAPPASTNPDTILLEASRAESIRRGRKRTIAQLDVGGLKHAAQEARGKRRKADGVISRKEAKKRKVYKVNKGDKVDWEGLQPLWWMHLGYLSELLGLPDYPGSDAGPTAEAIASQPQVLDKGKGKEKSLRLTAASNLLWTGPGKTHGMSNESLQSKLIKCDMVGAMIKVKCAKSPNLTIHQGIVLQESAGTFKLVNREGEVKIIPKNNSLFTLTFPAFAYESLPGRPGPGSSRSGSKMLSSPSIGRGAMAEDNEGGVAFGLTYDPFGDETKGHPAATTSFTSSAFAQSLELLPQIEIDILGSAFVFRTEDRAGRRFKPKEGGGGWEEDWVGWWGDSLV